MPSGPKPSAVRVLISKPGGGERPLGTPPIRGRVAQTAVKLILEKPTSVRHDQGSGHDFCIFTRVDYFFDGKSELAVWRDFLLENS